MDDFDVLPRGGVYVGMVMSTSAQGKVYPVRTFFCDVDALDAWARSRAEAGFDVYFWTASGVPGIPGHADAHIQQLQCLVHDIDVGKPGGFRTQGDALNALHTVVRSGAVPEPTYIVSSGHGVHVYWVLTHPVDVLTKRDMDTRIEHGLKSVPELLVDRVAITRAAAILRWPGTFNYKRGGKTPVEVLSYGPRHLDSDILRLPAPEVAPKAHTPAVRVETGEAVCTGRHLEANCVAMQEYRTGWQDKPGTFQLWSSVMKLAAYTEDPERWATAWSEGPIADLPRALAVVRRDVELRLSQLPEDSSGPTSCEALRRFMNLPLAKCQRCPLFNRASSPVFLEREATRSRAVARPLRTAGLVAVSAVRLRNRTKGHRTLMSPDNPTLDQRAEKARKSAQYGFTIHTAAGPAEGADATGEDTCQSPTSKPRTL